MTINTTLFLSMFDPRSSIIKMFSIAAYPVCFFALLPAERASKWHVIAANSSLVVRCFTPLITDY